MATTFDVYGPDVMLACDAELAASVLDVDTDDMLATIEEYGWCGGILQPDGEHVVAILSDSDLPSAAIEYLAH